ncbi:hypothetical protein [Prescottella agglutinans]|uniref:MmpS family membrane protein n=1 Tax=Prescottella agglutinans TaxID=1644129 RepID=A0ABT6MIW5_9NOCA|nr:hypothetical protein [Prescottella agglutinans]MDH6284261.1 hypothetical protein [Prescottella agglutinans]
MTDPNPSNEQNPPQQSPMPGAIPPGYQLQPVKKKKWPWVVVGIVLVFILLIGGCVAVLGKAVDEVDKQINSTAAVSYEVSLGHPVQGGVLTTNIAVTYTTGDGNISQDTAATVPWQKDVEVTGFTKYVSVGATNDATDQMISCTIRQGDRVISTNTASGPFASVSCSGTADSE